MIMLNKESSTYRASLRLPRFQTWLQLLQACSHKYRKYGSFLPAQEELLKQVHSVITRSKAGAVTFTAPPASGKTHVIALCASYLHDRDISTCVVTPNNELKLEFENELTEVNGKSRKSVPVLTIGAYVRRRHQFDYALVDEAHNLRSAMELDSDMIKSIHLEKGDPLFDDVATSLKKNTGSIAKELSTESSPDILQKMKGTKDMKQAGEILRRLSEWRSFCIVSDTYCDLKFLYANPERRGLMPRRGLLLFSATVLDPEELQFYCGIPREVIQTVGGRQKEFVPKENIIYCYTSFESDLEKRNFVVYILKDTKLPSLILVNSNLTCMKWSKYLSNKLGKRVTAIQSGLHYTKRLRLYKNFLSRSDRILLTSSSVYWEGITIRNLRLLIIPNPPYPRPNLLEIAKGKHSRYSKITKRRLIQGMGRIGRSPLEIGLCLLLFRPMGLGRYVKPIEAHKLKSLIAEL